MLYAAVRIILCFILFIVCIFITKKLKMHNKRVLKISAAIVCLVICIALNFIPIENLFITFPTVQSSYKYSNTGNADLIINGTETDLVISGNKGSNNVLIIPKNNEGWKIGRGIDTKAFFHKNINSVSIRVYQYKDTQDYYIILTDMVGILDRVSDSMDSVFESREINVGSSNESYFEYFAYVNHLDENYSLTLNEEIIYILKE